MAEQAARPPRPGSSGEAGVAARTAKGMPLVVLRKVNKFFGDLHVLRDVSMDVDAGEVVVVIGPSGGW